MPCAVTPGKPSRSERRRLEEVARVKRLLILNKLTLAKIDALLQEAGTDRSKLLAVNVFLPAIVDFDAMNGVYDNWIDPQNPPARACVEARLADPDLRVEMTAVAAL